MALGESAPPENTSSQVHSMYASTLRVDCRVTICNDNVSDSTVENVL